MHEQRQSVRTTRNRSPRPFPPSRAPDDLRRANDGKSLRSRIIVVLGIVLIPAALIAFIWTAMQDQRLIDIKLDLAMRTAIRSAEDINAFLRDMNLLSATNFSHDNAALTNPGQCQRRMKDILRERRDYSFSALLVDDSLICFEDTGGALPSDDETGNAVSMIARTLNARSEHGLHPAFTLSPDGRDLFFGIRVARPEESIGSQRRDVLVIVALRLDMLKYAIATPRLGIDRGTAIMASSGEIIIQSSTLRIGDRWLPDNPQAVREAVAASLFNTPIRSRSLSGEPSHYFISPTANPGLLIMTGYPDSLLFATERSVLVSSLLPPLLMLIAAGVGTIWAVERFVVRWIIYLQRVTRVYGSGRLSARALHIGNAPREIAELGMSFNQMADNIANHAQQSDRAAREYATLLRELHHRVKNNFQVITSLLSLQKRSAIGGHGDEPTADCDGLRFIEDHVQAMSVAYRVGYSSGDLGEAPPAELIHDVIDCLRRSAGLADDQIIEEPVAAGHAVDLDCAIAIALYFAAALPPYLDAARQAGSREERPKVRISAAISTGDAPSDDDTPPRITLRLSFALLPPRPISPSPLQERLARAYIRQLDATPVAGSVEGEQIIVIPLATVSAQRR